MAERSHSAGGPVAGLTANSSPLTPGPGAPVKPGPLPEQLQLLRALTGALFQGVPLSPPPLLFPEEKEGCLVFILYDAAAQTS